MVIVIPAKKMRTRYDLMRYALCCNHGHFGLVGWKKVQLKSNPKYSKGVIYNDH